MNCPTNDWEAAPWDTSDAIADEQYEGFRTRSGMPIRWTAVRDLASRDGKLFGIDKEWFFSREVVCCAEHDGEQLLLIQRAWHGFPDPPQWGLASRAIGGEPAPWREWGYFADLPGAWTVPKPPCPLPD